MSSYLPNNINHYLINDIVIVTTSDTTDDLTEQYCIDYDMNYFMLYDLVIDSQILEFI